MNLAATRLLSDLVDRQQAFMTACKRIVIGGLGHAGPGKPGGAAALGPVPQRSRGLAPRGGAFSEGKRTMSTAQRRETVLIQHWL
jgi:hypothetical protein